MIRPFSQWFTLLVALAVLGGVAYNEYRGYQERENAPAKMRAGRGAQNAIPNVRVTTVSTDSHAAQLQGFAEATPTYQIQLSTQTSGQVQQVSDAFAVGRQVKKGAELVRLDDSNYRAAVASAEYQLASAQLALKEEERQGKQARLEWEASGLTGEPDSDLVLRVPQLEAAKAAVTQAKVQLTQARQQLSQTRLTAPFDALIVERATAPGAYLSTGSKVATLYSTAQMDIRLSLSLSDWDKLPTEDALLGSHWPVTLRSVETGEQWTGHVVRTDAHLDSQTRQRALVIGVENPLSQSPPLLPGTFLQVNLLGKPLANLWQLPGSALSQQGDIWYLAEQNKLDHFQADVVFSDATSLYIRVPEALREGTHQVLVKPLNSYLAGMTVQPVQESKP